MKLPQGIKGLSDTVRLTRAGRIRLGEKVARGGKEYPSKLDHFNFVDAPKVGEIYGENCRELDILFPVDDETCILDLAYIRYGATGWKCRGDGEAAWNREADDEIECLGPDCSAYKAGECKRQARFSFVCYRVPGGLSIYDIVTSGRRSIENLVGGLSALRGLFRIIANIPLKLYLEPYQTTYLDAGGKQHTTNAYALRIDVAASILEVKRVQLGGGKKIEMPALPDECADDMYPKELQEPVPEPPLDDAGWF